MPPPRRGGRARRRCRSVVVVVVAAAAATTATLCPSSVVFAEAFRPGGAGGGSPDGLSPPPRTAAPAKRGPSAASSSWAPARRTSFRPASSFAAAPLVGRMPPLDAGASSEAEDGGPPSSSSEDEEFVMPDPTALVSDVPPSERGIGVGIDLGTTNSAAAVLIDGVPTIVEVEWEGRTMPSVVTLLANAGGGEDEEDRGGWDALVGREAVSFESSSSSSGADDDKEEAEAPPLGRTYRHVKRVIGTGGVATARSAGIVPHLVVPASASASAASSYSGGKRGKGKKRSKKKRLKKEKSPDELPGLLRQMDDAVADPALLVGPDGSSPLISPERISSLILRRLFDAAEDEACRRTGRRTKVTRAVVGVPAYFHDAQRDATLRACALAGVEKTRLLREPEAAALAYGIGRDRMAAQGGKKGGGAASEDELVLVFDLGGGTFDVSVLEVGGGVTEVIATAGDAALGGSDFDARIAEYLGAKIREHEPVTTASGAKWWKDGEVADALARSAEAVRIWLSNNRNADLALPLTPGGWRELGGPRDVILDPKSPSYAGILESLNVDELDEAGASNSTHALLRLSRRSMEKLCSAEIRRLLRPVREVAVLSGAMLPGDSSPEAVMAAMEVEEELAAADAAERRAAEFEDFYDERTEEARTSEEEHADVDPDTLLMLKEIDVKERKRAQQRGRRKARELASGSRKFRREKQRASDDARFGGGDGGTSAAGGGGGGGGRGKKDNVKVRDGIHGRPLSRIVLVGGATRTPAVGRLLSALTGVVPQRTVNPDEAVALGCAVQVGILDGDDGLGEGAAVLTPWQAALMRGLARKRGLQEAEERMDEDDFLDEEFDEGEVIYGGGVGVR